MHIPVGETTNQSILTFQEALERHAPDKYYDCEKWLYVPDFYSEYRYILGTRGKRPLITIGINPSTAEPDNLDNTLKSVERISLYNGFDSFLMFNVYAQRATRPDDMDRVFNELLHQENMKAFRCCLEQSEGKPVLWAAWGAIVEKRAYLMDCIRDMAAIGREYDAEWVKAGAVSKKGHPHHPLYLRKDSPVEPFDITGYLSGIEA